MAGFAVVMTFLTWGFILTIVSIVLSISLFRFAKRSFPDSTYAAKRYRRFNVAAPFLALGWHRRTYTESSCLIRSGANNGSFALPRDHDWFSAKLRIVPLFDRGVESVHNRNRLPENPQAVWQDSR
jgi:hypothetical protein